MLLTAQLSHSHQQALISSTGSSSWGSTEEQIGATRCKKVYLANCAACGKSGQTLSNLQQSKCCYYCAEDFSSLFCPNKVTTCKFEVGKNIVMSLVLLLDQSSYHIGEGLCGPRLGAVKTLECPTRQNFWARAVVQFLLSESSCVSPPSWQLLRL